MNRLATLTAAGVTGLLCASLAAGPRPLQETFERLYRTAPTGGEAELTTERLLQHVTWLASDENRGRKTAGGILEGRVADYLEAELSALGLAPRGDKEGTTYRQPFYAYSWGGGDAASFRFPARATDRASFGVLANQYGVALDRNGKPVTSDPLPAERLQELLAPGNPPNTFNLVALLEGSDPELASELVVIGAHMDHIGTSRYGAGSDKICNGADDNGSGTAALLSIGHALAKDRADGHGPARSVLLCFFSGEEMGLLGSQFFAGNPTVDLAKVKAMLNLDMIARGQPGQVSVCDDQSGGGQNLFHALHDASETSLDQVDHNISQYLRYSDQYPFYRKGVPVIFFFEGFEANGELNPDYHQPGDHVEKLDIPKFRDLTRFAYRHLLGAANLR
ncbi:MAG: M28 family peptidase [Candidatus Riflebacteria bacterium]|nr:M28 family peptidase [Candidatus Riflebacteria bacterium]